MKKALIARSQQKIYDSVGIVGAVRAGLVIQLKESLGTLTIMNRHEKLCKYVQAIVQAVDYRNRFVDYHHNVCYASHDITYE